MVRLGTQELSDEDLLIGEPFEVPDPTSRVADLLCESTALIHLRSDYLRELSECSTVTQVTGSRSAFYLNDGLYFVTRGALRCHLGRLSFALHRGQFAGTHSILDHLRGITPAFTCASSAELLHVPLPVALRMARHWPSFREALESGPLFTHLMDAAWHVTPSSPATV